MCWLWLSAAVMKRACHWQGQPLIASISRSHAKDKFMLLFLWYFLHSKLRFCFANFSVSIYPFIYVSVDSCIPLTSAIGSPLQIYLSNICLCPAISVSYWNQSLFVRTTKCKTMNVVLDRLKYSCLSMTADFLLQLWVGNTLFQHFWTMCFKK